MNVLEKMNEIEMKAKELNKQENRVIKEMKVGQCVRQGDLYIHKVEDNHEVGEEVNIRQLADGVSLGARHILKGPVQVFIGKKHPENVNTRYPLGYAFKVSKDGAILTHPEHAHIDICDEGMYQVTHQMDMRTLRRVSD